MTSDVIVLTIDWTLIFPSVNELMIHEICRAVRQQMISYRREMEMNKTRYNETT